MVETDTPNRVAIVTGSSRGIGRAIALELARGGHHIVVNCKSNLGAAQEVQEEAMSCGVRALVVQADVTVEADVKSLVEATCAELGRIDVLVNNAGVLQDTFLAFMSEQQWDTVLDVNLKSAFLCSKHASKVMAKQRWGRIINISSAAGLMGDTMRTNYSAAKAGLLGFTKAAARELAARGVTVNAVAPGFIETDMTAEMPVPRKEQALARIPMQRFGAPDDVARLIAFLAGDKAAYITGQVLSVDGGLHM
ncbi:MAG: 3-oxoacyl-[acyl-carrier-protein] reductase [Armatimonadetes bacterium]|nr:3-oxoacyl-[acyl-carrier-protein] reductase [Armatimonadota bacterium]